MNEQINALICLLLETKAVTSAPGQVRGSEGSWRDVLVCASSPPGRLWELRSEEPGMPPTLEVPAFSFEVGMGGNGRLFLKITLIGLLLMPYGFLNLLSLHLSLLFPSLACLLF